MTIAIVLRRRLVLLSGIDQYGEKGIYIQYYTTALHRHVEVGF